jgi:hypothetical protein
MKRSLLIAGLAFAAFSTNLQAEIGETLAQSTASYGTPVATISGGAVGWDNVR